MKELAGGKVLVTQEGPVTTVMIDCPEVMGTKWAPTPNSRSESDGKGA